jgi:hypothetical protein
MGITSKTKVNMKTRVVTSCDACNYEYSVDLEPSANQKVPGGMRVVRDDDQKN